MSSFRSCRTALQAPRSPAFAPHQLAANYQSLSPLRIPYKDDQDRNSPKPKSTEGSSPVRIRAPLRRTQRVTRLGYALRKRKAPREIRRKVTR